MLDPRQADLNELIRNAQEEGQPYIEEGYRSQQHVEGQKVAYVYEEDRQQNENQPYERQQKQDDAFIQESGTDGYVNDSLQIQDRQTVQQNNQYERKQYINREQSNAQQNQERRIEQGGFARTNQNNVRGNQIRNRMMPNAAFNAVNPNLNSQLTQVSHSQASSKERQVSPNRYFSTGEPIKPSQASKSPPSYMLYSFGGAKVLQQINIASVPVGINTHPNLTQPATKSRIISDNSGRQTLIIPGNVPTPHIQIKPQSTIISRPERISPVGHIQPIPGQISSTKIISKPVSVRLNQSTIPISNVNFIHPPSHPKPLSTSFDSSRPVVIERPRSNVTQIRSMKTSSNFNSQIYNSQIQQQPVTILGIRQPHVTLNYVSPSPIQSIHHIAPPNSAKIITIQNWYTETITKYVQLSNRVTSIRQTAHEITELMVTMHRSETDRQKQNFIENLLNQQTLLQEKLVDAQQEANQVIRQNKELETQITSQHRIMSEQVQRNEVDRIKEAECFQELEKIKQELKNFTSTKEKLQKTIESLKKQNTDLKTKYDDLNSGRNNIQEELTKTIQSQKMMIKKLEQELIQVHNEANQQNQRNLQKQGETEASRLEAAWEVKRKAQQDKLLAVIDSKEAYINELQAEIIRYKTQIKNLKQALREKEKNERTFSLPIIQEKPTSVQLEISNRKNSLDSSQIGKLQKIISEKDEELDKVKLKIFDIQKQFDMSIDEKNERIKNLLQQIINLNKKIQQAGDVQLLHNQNSNLKESLKVREEERSKLQETVNSLQIKLRSLESSAEHHNISQEEVNNMINTIKKRENEISQLNQAIELHVKNIQRLENEIGELTQKYKVLEQGFLEERKLSSQRSIDYEAKLKELEARALEKQHKNHEHDVAKYKSTIKQLKKRIKQLQDSHIQTGQRVSDTAGEEQDFRKQYSQSQVKIFQLEATVRNKENKIKQLEANLETMKVKVSARNVQGQDLINQQQIEMLRKKLTEYQSKLAHKNTDTLLRNYKIRDYESINVFEQKVIYDLKNENERLRAMLGGESCWKNASIETEKIPRNEQSCVVSIQKRLQDFNKRLEEMILQNKEFENLSRNQKSNITVNTNMLELFEREKLVIFRRHKQQIQSLQARMIDLQRYCSSLEQNQAQTSVNYSVNKKQTINEASHIYSEQLTYYKQKNRELEERVDKLLKFDKELKEKYEQALKNQGGQSTEYYTQQISILEGKIREYQSRIRILAEQHDSNLKELEEVRNSREYQNKIQSLELTIKELNGKIQRLEQEKIRFNLDLRNYTNQSTSESFNHKSLLNEKDQKISSLEAIIKSYNSKTLGYEEKITRQSNQVEILKAEIQRLQQQIFKSRNKDSEINSLREQNQWINHQNHQLKTKAEAWQYQRYNINMALNALQSKYDSIQSLYTTEKDRVNDLNQRISKLQEILRQVRSEKERLQFEIENLSKQLQSAQRNSQIAIDVQYKVELIRSFFIEFETLLSQLLIQQEPRQIQIIHKFKSQINTGFEVCGQILDKL